jgi:N-acetylglucosamine kinase-like BadF-type ATPase
MAWARDNAGKSYRCGGWGEIIGDEGSSHWIGRRVLSLISQSIDGRAPPTPLVEAVFDALKLSSDDPIEALEGWVSRLSHPRAEIGALAPIATRLAEAGDQGSIAIVEAAAEELARLGPAIARLAGIDIEWSYAGGTFNSRLLRDAVARRLGRPPLPPRLPPIGGALLAAAQHLGWPVQAAWIDRLAASIEAGPAGIGTLQATNAN